MQSAGQYAVRYLFFWDEGKGSDPRLADEPDWRSGAKAERGLNGGVSVDGEKHGLRVPEGGQRHETLRPENKGFVTM